MTKDKLIEKSENKQTKKNDNPVKKDDDEKVSKVFTNKNQDDKPAKKSNIEKIPKDQDDKPSKKSNVEKVPKDLPNKDTVKAKLCFNVKTTNKWMKEYCSSYVVEKKKKEDKTKSKNDSKTDNDNEQKKKDDGIKMNGGHYALTSIDEALCIEMANLAFVKTTKDKAGLYLIKEDTLFDSLKLNNDFVYSFSKFFNAYSSKEKYGKQLGIEKKDVLKLLEIRAFSGGNTCVNLDDNAYNLMMYIVLKNRILVLETTYQMLLYAKKASIDGRAIIHSVKAVYSGTTELHIKLSQKAEGTNLLVKGDKPKDESEDGEKKDNSNNNNNDSDNDCEKNPKKETKKNKLDSDSDNESNTKSESSESDDE